MLSGKHIIREITFSVFCNSGNYISGSLHSGNHRRVKTTNISHLVKKRKKSESEAEAGTVATNGDAAKKPHIEAVATNGNGHTNGN